ncbi:uncharacterized protein LOC113664096 [Tachysurus ichikawai]
MFKTASETEPPRNESTGSDTDFTLDTASIPSNLPSPSSTVREERWPPVFQIPNFSYDVEFRLRKANEVYEKQNTTMDVTRDVKSEILEKLAETIYSFKAYPSDSEIEQDTDLEETYTRGVKLAILAVMEDDLSQATKRCLNFGIILEETVVMEDLPDFPTAFMVFFGLLYMLNIEYPKGLKYTFEAVQNIFVELGEKCTNRVQSLKNKLFEF